MHRLFRPLLILSLLLALAGIALLSTPRSSLPASVSSTWKTCPKSFTCSKKRVRATSPCVNVTKPKKFETPKNAQTRTCGDSTCLGLCFRALSSSSSLSSSSKSSSSTASLCGNSKIDGEEQCDEGKNNGSPLGKCSASCILNISAAVCGDGICTLGADFNSFSDVSCPKDCISTIAACKKKLDDYFAFLKQSKACTSNYDCVQFGCEDIVNRASSAKLSADKRTYETTCYHQPGDVPPAPNCAPRPEGSYGCAQGACTTFEKLGD